MLTNKPALKTTLFCACGIAAASVVEFGFNWIIPIAGGLLFLLLMCHYLFKSSGISFVLLFILIAFLTGFFRLSLTETSRLPDSHLTKLNLYDTYVTVDGWVSDVIEYHHGGETITVSLSRIQARGIEYSDIDGKINVSLRDSTMRVGIGDNIEMSGILVRPAERRNPGEMNSRTYLARKDVYGILRIPDGAQITVHADNRVNTIKSVLIYPIRTFLSTTLKQFHTGQELAFLQAILLGQRTGVETDILNDFRNAGTLHILAVSGLHVGFIILIIQSVLMFFPLGKRWQSVFLIVIVLVYILLTGARPPVLRAGIFACLYYFGITIQRRRDTWNILGVTALLILLMNPNTLFDPGFQLSFAAIAGILYFKGSIQPIIYKLEGMTKPFSFLWLWRQTISLFFMSAGAFFGTSFFMAYHFHYLVPGGIFTSVIIVPLATLTVGLGLAELLFGSMSVQLGSAIGATNDVLIQTIFAINRFAGDVSFMRFIIGHYEIIWVLISIASVFFIVLVYTKPLFFRITLGSAGIVVLILWALWLNRPIPVMNVTFLDVGQGDATVISFPDDTHWLIDGGNSWDTGDAGNRHVIPYLRWAGIRKLDGVFLSHPNRDHYGGLESVMRHVEVGKFYESIDSQQFIVEDEFFNLLQTKGIERKLIHAGDSIISRRSSHQEDKSEDWRMYVLSPSLRLNPDSYYGNTNDISMTLLIQYGQTKLLITSDIGFEVENEILVKYGSFLDSDILKVAHHGSKYSSDVNFLEAVSPQFSVISSGKFNSYGHPAPETLQRLRKVTTEILRTDSGGAIEFVSDGMQWSIVHKANKYHITD